MTEIDFRAAVLANLKDVQDELFQQRQDIAKVMALVSAAQGAWTVVKWLGALAAAAVALIDPIRQTLKH